MNRVHPVVKRKTSKSETYTNITVTDVETTITEIPDDPPSPPLSTSQSHSSQVTEEGDFYYSIGPKEEEEGYHYEDEDERPVVVQSRGYMTSICVEDYTSAEIKMRDEQQRLLMKDRMEEERLKRVFVDKNMRDEEYDVIVRNEEARLAEFGGRRVLGESEDPTRKDRLEEERLRRVFVDKNARDAEYDAAVEGEESRLRVLVSEREESETSFDLLAAHAEDYRLKDILENKEIEKYEDDELDRLQAMLGSKKVEEIPLLDTRELDVGVLAENVKQVSSGIVESTLNEESAHDIHTQRVLSHNSNVQTSEWEQHNTHRHREEKKLQGLFEKAERWRRLESVSLTRLNTRRNISIVEQGHEEMGKIILKTPKGILTFELNESCEIKNENNSHSLCEECEVVCSHKRHLHNKDCRYENVVSNLTLFEDIHLENVVDGVYDFDSLHDATGQKLHNARDDMVIRAIVRDHFIPESSYPRETNNHVIFKDATFVDLKVHDIHTDSVFLNVNRKHDLCKQGVFVQRARKMTIPLPHTTEFRNSSSHFIPEKATVVNRSKQFDLNPDSTLIKSNNRTIAPIEGELINRTLSTYIPEDSSQDDHYRVFIISAEGDQDDHANNHMIPGPGVLVHNTRYNIPPGERRGMVRNRCYHHHHRDSDTFSPWKNSRFSIPEGGSLVHNVVSNTNCCTFTEEWKGRSNDFHLADDLSIDDDYLDE